MPRDDSGAANDRLLPCHGDQPFLRPRVRRCSLVLLLRNRSTGSVLGDGGTRRNRRDSDARLDGPHGRLVRRQCRRNLRLLRSVQSLRRAAGRRTESVCAGVRGLCSVRRVDCWNCVLRRQRPAATSRLTHQG